MRKLRLGKVKQLISSRYMISIDWLHSPCTQTNIPCSPILKTKYSRERTDLSSAWYALVMWINITEPGPSRWYKHEHGLVPPLSAQSSSRTDNNLKITIHVRMKSEGVSMLWMDISLTLEQRYNLKRMVLEFPLKDKWHLIRWSKKKGTWENIMVCLGNSKLFNLARDGGTLGRIAGNETGKMKCFRPI